jgi:hypothetical protein
MITDLFGTDAPGPALALQRSRSARLSIPPRAPTWRNARRLIPSQNLRPFPQMVSMARASSGMHAG